MWVAIIDIFNFCAKVLKIFELCKYFWENVPWAQILKVKNVPWAQFLNRKWCRYIIRAEKFSALLLFIYSHIVAIYHLQGFCPIYSAAILQPMSLCIIYHALAHDVELTIDEVLLYAFVVHAASIDLVDVGRHTRLTWLDMERKATFVGSLW